MKKRILLIILAILAALTPVTCTGRSTSTPLTVEQVLAQAKQYNGKIIVVEAFYYHGFETIALVDRIEPSGNAPGHLIPIGRLIWVEGGIPKETYDKLYVQQQL